MKIPVAEGVFDFNLHSFGAWFAAIILILTIMQLLSLRRKIKTGSHMVSTPSRRWMRNRAAPARMGGGFHFRFGGFGGLVSPPQGFSGRRRKFLDYFRPFPKTRR